MQPFFEWFASSINPSEPWLVLGKGPTFALRGGFDLSRFKLLSLNHAVREQPVLVAHVIDLDVVESCGSVLERNAGVLVMPWYPHICNEVGTRTLAEIAEEVPVLRRLEQDGRLLWYDLSTSPTRHGTLPVVQATYFSAEAALNLLALAGVRCVRSLGIDGGSAYSGAFQDLRASTLLANGRMSFDLQFEGFARTIMRTGVDFAPLDRPTPVLVYSAYSPAESLSLAVLHHSIRRRASITVEVLGLPDGGGPQITKGQALILPARAQMLADVRGLWSAIPDDEVILPADNWLAGGAGLALVGSALSAAMPALASAIRKRASPETLSAVAPVRIRSTLPAEWNPSSSVTPPVSPLLLYFPPDGSEPWVSRSHPFGHLWMRDLLDGVAQGCIPPALVAEAVRRGQVRPSLLFQVEHGLEEPLLLPRRARLLDRQFSSARPSQTGATARARWTTVLRALGRQVGRWTRQLRQGHPPQSDGTSDSQLVAPR